MTDDIEVCVNCGMRVFYSTTIKGEWTHSYGGTYCLDENGFTATPLRTVRLAYHGTGDTL